MSTAPEPPSLEQHHAGGTLELVLEQRPYLGGWVRLVSWSQAIALLLVVSSMLLDGLLTSLLGSFYGVLLGLGCGWFVISFFLHLHGMGLRRPARLTATPTVLSVEACMGWLALPQTVLLSLDRVALEHKNHEDDKEKELRQLTLTDGEHTCTVPGLACTTAELERVRAVLSAAADHARSVQGEGEAEVPAPLRGFLRAPPEGR